MQHESGIQFPEEPAAESSSPLVEHFFRHESGRLVSSLTRVFGMRNFDLVEDMVQSALLEAFTTWRLHGIPDNPSAWMRRVAKNRILDALRHRAIVTRLAPEWARLRAPTEAASVDHLFLDAEIEDSQLRMIFACCHPVLSRENQIALTLKSLCGFSNAEIAKALLTNVETIKKRIQRAKKQLVEQDVALVEPDLSELPQRLDSVHQCLYLLFNEGYLASGGERAVREDLCEEAARLCHLLCAHPRCHSPATFALLALMLFHAARLSGRTDTDGRILLLEDQDRTQWDARLIAAARRYLDHSATGQTITTYHLEAGIALHHCAATSFAATDWKALLQLYDGLLRIHPSPVYRLNRAIVICHVRGPASAIQELQSMDSGPLQTYYLWDATLGELYRRLGELELARHHLEQAKIKTQSLSEQELLARRIAACVPL